MNHFTTSPQDRLAMDALSQVHKPGDYLVLADRTLNAALDGTRALRQSEWKALLESPLTLRRMRVLEAMRLARVQTTAGPVDAANDDVWRPSQGLLRAAADMSDGNFSQASEDGRWMLYALKTGAETRLVLKLQAQAEHADIWMAARPEVAVLDGAGNTLLLGALDEDGEVHGPWVQDTDVRSHLAAHGHRWLVERV